MAANRWRRWLGLLVMAVGWWGVCTAEAHGAGRDVCDMAQAGTLQARSALRFSHHGQTYVQAQADTDVTVPDKWRLENQLPLGEKSKRYRQAMRCLLRAETKPNTKPTWKDEWRLHSPEVKTAPKGHGVTVRYKAFALIKHTGETQIGPWHIDARKPDHPWHATFRPTMLGKVLAKAHWKQVKVRLDGLAASDVRPKAAYAGKGRWVWDKRRHPPRVRVDVFPPWHAAFALENRGSTLSRLGLILWWVCGSAALALAVLRTAPRSPSPPRPSERFWLWPPWRVPAVSDGSKRGLARTALWWAGLSAALGLALALLIPGTRGLSVWPTLAGIAAGLVLILAARPWLPDRSTDKPKWPTSKLNRRGRAFTRNVFLTSLSLVALGLVAVLAPGTMGLPGELAPPDAYTITLMLLQLVMVWLWLIAMAAWAWRFVRDGGLARASWTAAWDTATIRFMAASGAVLAVAAVVMLYAYRWSVELNWRRSNWLLEHDPTYDRAHDQNLHNTLAGFGSIGLSWAYTHTWVLTTIALVALLNSRADAARSEPNTEQISLGPSRNDMRLTAVVFALAVVTRAQLFAGSSLLLTVWLLLNIAAVYAVRATGRRWSVLHQAGGAFLTQTLGTAQGRRDMLEKAHQYRNLHHRLRLVDQGHTEQDMTREALEDRLRRLRRWRPPGYDRGFLPDQVSVVDVALSWGPHDKWWDNALHGARIAFLFGIPSSAVIVWANYFKSPKQLLLTSASATGLPDIAAWFVTWQITWAGAGLVLGALWRVLPGHRGPMRALSLTIAYAIPIGVGALVNRITDTELGNAVLSISLMLIVLTLTSIWMDMATFSGERQLWPTRLSLLLSIYQARTLSVHAAFLIAQFAAAATIWNDLAGPLKP
ncbi:DUF6185 family protein [Streptomyces rhizosphaericus]|uniref:DUF6185 family protein n=1 Tax=Streptomyces rhizosphaericus TaxID=114699 RepID=UPI00117D193B|nr:DUF6185 family protein [Streptomyces rhizosphaericus]